MKETLKQTFSSAPKEIDLLNILDSYEIEGHVKITNDDNLYKVESQLFPLFLYAIIVLFVNIFAVGFSYISFPYFFKQHSVLSFLLMLPLFLVPVNIIFIALYIFILRKYNELKKQNRTIISYNKISNIFDFPRCNLKIQKGEIISFILLHSWYFREDGRYFNFGELTILIQDGSNNYVRYPVITSTRRITKKIVIALSEYTDTPIKEIIFNKELRQELDIKQKMLPLKDKNQHNP